MDANGEVRPPFTWNDDDRRKRLSALDALFFWLYGVGADDARHVLGTFPIVQAQDEREFGGYRSQEDVLRWLSLLG